MQENCDTHVGFVLFRRGERIVNETQRSIETATVLSDCCRQKKRFDLAIELLDQVESFPLGKQEPFASKVTELRAKIAAGNTIGTESTTSAQQPLPPLRERVWNFLTSAVEHAADGFQRCEQSEIDARLAICESCPNLRDDNLCSACGCGCSADNSFISKLAWRSSHCPLDPPKW
jgi:hypothetical protein